MGQARADSNSIARREQMIEALSQQIGIWTTLNEATPQLDLLRRATSLSIEQLKKDIDNRVKTLSFATEQDRLDLAKLQGKLDGVESVYYDISDAPKRIEQAKARIATLVEEIRRAKNGELLDTRA